MVAAFGSQTSTDATLSSSHNEGSVVGNAEHWSTVATASACSTGAVRKAHAQIPRFVVMRERDSFVIRTDVSDTAIEDDVIVERHVHTCSEYNVLFASASNKRVPVASTRQNCSVKGSVLIKWFVLDGGAELIARIIDQVGNRSVGSRARHDFNSKDMAFGSVETDLRANLYQVTLEVPIVVQVIDCDTILNAIIDATKQSSSDKHLLPRIVGDFAT